MRYIFIFLILISNMFTSVSQTPWSFSKSTITFKIKNSGILVDGSLKGLKTEINFSPSNLSNSSIEASVAVSTINTGIDMRDNHLKNKDYFDEKKHPRINLKSVSFSKKKDGSFIGNFKLTLKGKVKDISIPFTFTESADKATFVGSFKINRLDYDIGSDSWTLSNDVSIRINLNVVKKI